METKNIKEILVGANELTLLILTQLKDGFQVGQDLSAIVSGILGSEDLKTKLMAAGADVGQVVAEAKDLDLQEGVELAMLQVSYVPKLVAALKK